MGWNFNFLQQKSSSLLENLISNKNELKYYKFMVIF